MKKLFSLLSLWLLFSVVGLAQGSGPITVKEADGSPICNNCRTFIFGNGTLTVSGNAVTIAGGGGGGVTSVGGSFTGGLISVSGSPVTTSGTLAFTVAGTSGGVPYFSSTSTWASSPLLVANALMIGGGAGNPPATTTTGTGVITALGVNTGSAGAFVVNGGALGTPSGGTATNLTGLPPTTGIVGWPANASGVLTNNGSGTLSWAAAGGGITVGTTTVTSGTATRLFYETAGNVVGQVSGATSDGTNVTFGSGNLLATSPAFTTNQTTTNDAIGTTSTDGIVLINNTAAAAGAQQYSPRLRLTGQGWKTNATAASQTTDWIIQAVPVQGAANPTVDLHFLYQVNGAGYANTISTGRILAPGGSSTSQSLPQYSAVNQTGAGMRIGAGNAGNAVALMVNSAGRFIIDANASRAVVSSSWGLSWGNADSAGSVQVGLYSPASDVLQIRDRNSSTVGGNLILGGSGSSLPTSATATLVLQNGTVPGSSPANQFSLYSADSAAGDANAFIRNEAGEINRVSGLAARNSSSFAKTSDTTLANITGLTRNVEAGRAYAFTATLQTTAAATGGVKFAVSGTATATSISYEGVLVDTAVVVAQTRATALNTTVCASTTSTAGTCTIKGVLVTNAAGTLTIQFAQNASDGGASTVLVNQFMQLVPIS